MNRRGNVRRYECEPPEKVYAYKAKLVKTRRNSAKIQLVPTTFTTPKNKRALSQSGSKSGGQRSRVEELLASAAASARAGPGNEMDWGNSGDVFIPFEVSDRDVIGKANRAQCLYRNRSAPFALTLVPEFCGGANICFGRPLLCTECCKDSHRRNPFHRVEVWNKTHFTPSWLWRTGLILSLCPSGRCDQDRATLSDAPDALPEPDDCTYGAKPDKRVWEDDISVIVVVHLTGIHHLPVRFCSCHDAADNDIQLLRFDLYPTSYKEARSAFTFQLLDDYLLQNLECNTSAFHYYSKLRRLTNTGVSKKGSRSNLHGTCVQQDRYRELLRCSREWRRLKELKRHGFSHLGRAPEEGEMALYCAACPQPDVNLPADWRDDPEQWKYYVTLVADGNFSLVHRKQKGDEDVWLKRGEGYLVERTRYAKHIKSTNEKKEAPTCHEHRAVEDRSKTHKGCDVTGVGAFACSRHGAFAPGSVVDFQKGERQMNMDYGLCGAIISTGASKAKRLNLLYDIACQYHLHLAKRLKEGRYLTHWDSLELVFGIGKFHVFGHQERCFARHSPLFIEGSGWTAGEILESLWSVLNEAAKPTQTMTLAHRTEVLDALIADSNFKKMINLVLQLGGHYVKSEKELMKATEAFELLDATASTAQRTSWKGQLDKALEGRLTDVGAMDILNVTIDKPPSRSQVQHELMVSEQEGHQDVGVTSWLTRGLKIQESQLLLKSFVKGLPRDELRTDLQLVELAEKRERLQADLDAFVSTAVGLFPSVEFGAYERPPDAAPEIDNEDPDDSDIDDVRGASAEEDNPYLYHPHSPSLPPAMKRARKKEIHLRIAQANDALEGIRTEIGHKSFLYRSDIRLAQGKKQKTRGYQSIKAADSNMRHHLRLYNHARWALTRLRAKPSILDRFKAIRKEDTKAITAVYQPNAPGQSKLSLSWIWSVDVKGDSENSTYLSELYRVNWIRAKARLDRWKEENTLIRCEMGWMLNFFDRKEKICLGWADMSGNRPGHRAYAYRQAEMWRLLACEARRSFKSAQETAEQLTTNAAAIG
ncbi:hypothetical protein CC1G_15677 [Coprinopsis cinerea okayama7|uniref:CxC2-like cysteine cluster KDZ transposase-associated domain-containing protein n=1 Tax=Coprinopsis cinerea (strain Okayama-7 / 130 / ATCC MYA-4618 / FGSC 9003) TaxID=240176 RepID=D6RQD7_COPC7|nr:hypothetical protein CC1G_15677 [Coprinopsis cinerea okayama7\|eukprot:XP_002910247.1 hypothetical protein CC1G_15677 [Coprinopsis cinerea okayama7\